VGVRTRRQAQLEDEEEVVVKQEDADEVVVKREGADVVVKKEDDNADDPDLDLPRIDDINNDRS
jgi:hypothetical protein